MKNSEMIKVIWHGVICLCIIIVATSCDNDSDSHGERGNVKGGSESPTCAVVVPKELTQVELLEAECRRLVISAERKRGEKSTSYVINDLCRKIHELPREEALPLLDRWIEMAIKHPVTNANYSIRARMFEQAFDIVFFAINSSLDMRTDHFEHWDKVFRFYDKCTKEIMAMEKSLESQERPQHSPSYMYLRLFRGDVKNWVYRIRTVFFDVYSNGLTEEQKADVIRRLDEVEKFTVSSPSLSSGKK